MGGGDTTVSTPPVDPAQQALEQQQAAMLQQQSQILAQQQKDNAIIAPALYSSMGLTPTYDAQGNLTALNMNPNVAALNNIQLQVSQEALQQQQQALEGKLPVNPLVTQTLQQQQKQLQTTLSNNLGPGYGASTPGEQAQNNFNVSQAGIIQAANTGQMTLDQQLASAGTANYIGSNQNTLQSILGINGLGFATAGAYGQGANNYTNAMSPYMQQNQMSLQAQMANAQMAASQQQGQGALIGSGMGAAAMVGAAAFM